MGIDKKEIPLLKKDHVVIDLVSADSFRNLRDFKILVPVGNIPAGRRCSYGILFDPQRKVPVFIMNDAGGHFSFKVLFMHDFYSFLSGLL
jgi:hypothetical protein